MRVLQVYRTFFPETQGGLQEAVRQIAVGTREAGVQARVFTLAHDPEPAEVRVDGIEVQRARCLFEVASCDFAGPGGVRRFRQLAADSDLLHFHYPWPFGDLLYLAGARGKPAIVTYHSDVVRQQVLMRAYRPLMARFFDAVDAIVATSPQYVATSEVLSRYAGKVEVIPLGLDPASVAVDPGRVDAWRARLGEGFFMFVGVLRYYKGLTFLVEAARLTGLPVVIAGAGPEEAALRAQAAGLPHVHFPGRIDDADKFALLALSAAVVFPSHLRSEAFGVTLLEGELLGKPLITAEIGTGTSYVNAAGETGLVVPPADAGALAEAMRRLAGDAELRARMGAAGRERFHRLFTTARMGRAYADLYARVLARRG
jgi:rhamnosyl/mannosyltransferase